MSRLLLAYRTLANVVGVLLIVLFFVGLPLNELHRLNEAWFTEGTSIQQFGADVSKYLGITHGWLYMTFVGTAFALSRKAKWSVGFTITTILLGTIPIVTFWAEHRATRRVREHLAV